MHVLNAHPNVPAKGRYEEALAWQFQRYLDACTAIEQAGITIPFKVVASSKVLRLAGQSMALNAVDPGAALFSALNPNDPSNEYQPFHALKSHLIQVPQCFHEPLFCERGTFRIKAGMRIGIIPIGYSDGSPPPSLR